jgi:hypothetical protein
VNISKSSEGQLCHGDEDERTVRDSASETKIVKVQTRPEKIRGKAGASSEAIRSMTAKKAPREARRRRR